MRKALISCLVFISAVLVLLGTAFVLREDLARFAAGRLLADGQVTLTHLQGLHLNSTQLTITELEFLLHASGQRLRIADLDVDFRLSSMTSAPEVNAITIGSAQLLPAASTPDTAADVDEEQRQADSSGIVLSEILTLLREFPLASITVDALTLPQRSTPLAFTLQRGSSQLNARIDSGPLRLQTHLMQVDAATVARLEVILTRGGETVGDFALSLTPMDTVYALGGSGMLDIPDLNALLGELEQAPLAVPLRAAHLDWDLAGTIADNLGGESNNAETFVLGLQAGSTVTLPAQLAEGLGPVTVEFTDRMQVAVTSGAGIAIDQGSIPVRVMSEWRNEPVNVTAVLTLSDCALGEDPRCELGFDGNAGFGSYTLAGAVQLAFTNANEYHVATRGLTLGGLPDWLPAFDVAADLTVAEESLAFSTPVLLRNVPADAGLAIDGTYDLASGALKVHATLPELGFREAGGALSAWFDTWPHEFDVLTGSVAAELDVAWQDEVLTGTAAATLKDVGGFHGDYFFRGVNGALQADIDTAAAFPVHTPPLALTMAGLDVGVPLENLQLDFSLDRAGQLQIHSFSTDLLDGSVSGMDITYDFTRERNELVVHFDGLRIERMLDLVEYKGVEAIGAVSGEIPLTITPNGVEVADGMLAADAPGGTIRYLAAAMGATGNTGLDLMHQALGNYRFESLTSGIEYTPDGELLLEMKLQGHNPDMQNGQRINLNLNLSDNIPALLESLQAARRIEDFLELQYQ